MLNGCLYNNAVTDIEHVGTETCRSLCILCILKPY
jgi:hypothetical protein